MEQRTYTSEGPARTYSTATWAAHGRRGDAAEPRWAARDEEPRARTDARTDARTLARTHAHARPLQRGPSTPSLRSTPLRSPFLQPPRFRGSPDPQVVRVADKVGRARRPAVPARRVLEDRVAEPPDAVGAVRQVLDLVRPHRPAASAGATLRAIRKAGKFQAVKAAAMPMGSWLISTRPPGARLSMMRP